MRETQKKIKALRVSAGLTQQELAQRTAMQQQNIGRIEKAEIGVSLDTFEKLLAAMHHHVEIVPDDAADTHPNADDAVSRFEPQHPEKPTQKA